MHISNIRDGDTIIVRSDNAVSEEMAKKIKREFKRVFPKSKCIVLDSGLSYSIVSPVANGE